MSNILETIQEAYEKLKVLNSEIDPENISQQKRPHKLQKVLIANRGEIAKRFFLSLHEEKIPSVAVVTEVDRGQSWYEFADEVVFIGEETNYTSIPTIIAAAKLVSANAIYAGYGFLSENADFVEAIETYDKESENDLIFMGPTSRTMRVMGDKVTSRKLAKSLGVPLFESTAAFESTKVEPIIKQINEFGYPVIVKLSAGGGGKGMYPVFKEEELAEAVESCVRIGKDLYNDARFYIEQYIVEPVHIEVQVFNDRAVGIRKCAVQRRNQKIIEESGHTFLPDHQALSFLSAAEKLAIESGYGNCGAGTVEFLIDASNGNIGFMEMNTRLQVEYGVTDQSLSIDLAKWQILYFDGRSNEIEDTRSIKYRFFQRKHAIECRIYAEEPENDYRPSPGTITEINLPSFNGIRCDFGFGEGDKILSMYDPMIGKLIAYADSREEALIRMERALQELYVKGVKSNINQLLRIVRHEKFRDPGYTNLLIPKNDDLGFQAPDRKYLEAAKSQRHIVFGAFSEYIKYINQNAERFSVVASSQGILDTQPIEAPYRFTVEFENEEYLVEFIQEDLYCSHVLINGKYRGKLCLRGSAEDGDDLTVLFDSQIRRVRVEQHIGFSIIKIKDDTNRYNYYRMVITPEGVEEADTRGHVSSPFQGTFVSFCRDMKVGDRVEEGEKLVILSAMKMETVIQAPVSGTISYIIENGDISKLQIGKTSDGRIIGRPMQEGEVLVRIESEDDDESKSKLLAEIKAEDTDNTYELMMAQDGEEKILSSLDDHFDGLLVLFISMIKGFLRQTQLAEKLKTVMAGIKDEQWKSYMIRERSDKICGLILHYIYVRRMFSLVISDEGFSFPDEMDNFLRGWNDPDVELSEGFINVLGEVFDSYRIGRWKRGIGNVADDIHSLAYFMSLSYEAILRHWNQIGKKVNVVGNLDRESPVTQTTLQRLVEHTGYQIDDSSERFLKRVLDKYFPDREAELYAGKSDADVDLAADSEKNKVASLDDLKSLQSVPYIKTLCSKRKCGDFYYEKEFSLLVAVGDDTVTGYCSLDDVESLDTETVLKKAAAVFESYTKKFDKEKRHFEILTPETVFSLRERDRNNPDYLTLLKLARPLHKLLLSKAATLGLIHAKRSVEDGSAQQVLFSVSVRKNQPVIDILFDDSPLNPYAQSEANPADVKMFALEKWPIDRWADLLFDNSQYEEVTVTLADSGEKPAGSKIFTGKVGGEPACFYMKDYRIIGGATGNREGLKYAAACYLAYLKGWPLYVWNDSAGANIKEGMVSLNRGGQGFMMNSLLAYNAPLEKFRNYVSNVFDEDVKTVLSEMDSKFNLSLEEERGNKKTMVVAIGVGASAGLDVYGSSQATIQLILDSENSYRVLTGSNVIKSVMGEDISNYDIGGAVILGKWTGIADLVATDKLDLLRKITEIQYLFGKSEPCDLIQRQEKQSSSESEKYLTSVIDDTVIRNNVDGGRLYTYKDTFYASRALVAGFVHIAGNRALILGARTDSGLRAHNTVLKAREMMRMAYRTQTPQILVYGDNWVRQSISGTNLRPYYDYVKTLNEKVSHRIHIITSVAGLKNFDLTASADAVIFVTNKQPDEREMLFVNQNASFVVDTMEEAFDISAKILNLLEKTLVQNGAESGLEVTIPDDPATPFDMIESVIKPAFDKDSFLEFFAPFNKPTGPNFITGLARIDGQTVGVIADQPKIKGGGADSQGTEKYRVFTELCNSKNIPIVMLSNSSGFVPGSQQERFRIQNVGAESLDANILGEVPVVSVVLNQNYGGRQIQAFSKSLRPGIRYSARTSATLAVMGATAAYDLLGAKKYKKLVDEGKESEAQAFQKDFIDGYLQKARAENDAKQTGVIDTLVEDITKLRDHIKSELVEARREANNAFGEK
jgi:acetyl/propionyl-CoA carboxylase alpha subunit/acetyl-CoA carboxylase carboxyltransferase component